MFSDLVRWLWEHRKAFVRRTPWLRNGLLRLEALGRLFFRFSLRHPTLLILGGVGLTFAYFVYNPKILFPLTCYQLDPTDDGFKSSWDTRECQTGRVIAFTWSEPTDTPKGPNDDPLPTAGNRAMVNSRVIFQGINSSENKNLWSEIYMYTGGKRLPAATRAGAVAHGWSVADDFAIDTFADDGCSRTDIPGQKLFSRAGFILRAVTRPLNNDPSTWLQCTRGVPGDPNLAFCDWGRYEMFVPALSARWCKQNNFFDYGTRYISLLGHKEATLANWPWACFRVARLSKGSGEWTPTGWTNWGRINAVWCDKG